MRCDMSHTQDIQIPGVLRPGSKGAHVVTSHFFKIISVPCSYFPITSMILCHFWHLQRYEVQNLVSETCFVVVIMVTLTTEACCNQKFACLKWDAVGFSDLRPEFCLFSLYIKTYLLNINHYSNLCVKRGFGVYHQILKSHFRGHRFPSWRPRTFFEINLIVVNNLKLRN